MLSATILGRYVFYGGSAFDAGSSVASAIAPDKAPLLPGGAASFANYTSYSRGINGIAIDVVNWPTTPVAADFTLSTGNNTNPAGWSVLSQPVTYSIQRGVGVGGSDRVVLRLPDNAVRNAWLQVTVNPTADTGLSSSDTFYFGNAVADDGHNLSTTVVDSSNQTAASSDLHTFVNPASLYDKYDFNRDGRVDATDQVIARYSVNTVASALRLITAPAAPDPGTTGNFAGLFSVKAYGAKGDGTTDDTAAIQAAVTALSSLGHGLLYFPPGFYRTASNVTLQNLNNFEIRGVSATLMPTDTDGVTTVAGDIMRLTACSNFTVNGLTFDANASKRGNGDQPISLRLAGCADFRITACKFSHTVGDGLFLQAVTPANDATACHDGLIEGCTVNSAYRNGFSVIHASRVRIQGNSISNVAGTAPQAGIDIEANLDDSPVANHDMFVTGNAIYATAGPGIEIPGVQSPTSIGINSNTFGSCASAVFNEGINTVIANNVFHDATNPAGPNHVGAQVYCGTVNAQTATITGNIFYALSGMSAVWIDSTWRGQATIANNWINGVTSTVSNAISVWGDNAVVTGNKLDNTPLTIGITGNNADIESNTVSAGLNFGILVQGANALIRANTITGRQYGIWVADPSTGSVAGSVSTIDSNRIANCPTGLRDVAANTRVTNNAFTSAALPASGNPGSDALGQVYLYGITGGTAQITNNTFDSLTGLSAVYVHSSWSGNATVSSNQISNLSGNGPNAIAIGCANAIITSNNIQTSAGMGISVSGSNANVESNTVSTGPGAGIYVQGAGETLHGNTITGRQYGIWLADLSTGPIVGAVSTVDSNHITNCPTGLRDLAAYSRVMNNLFANALLPAPGNPGSDALAQVYLSGITGGTVQITGNSFDAVANLAAIYLHPTWSGTASVSSNQITNFTGNGPFAIAVGCDNAVITYNSIQTSAGVGISATGNNLDVESNTVSGGPGIGINLQGANAMIRANAVTGRQYGIWLADPSTGPMAGTVNTVDSNHITNCPTGLRDVAAYSHVTNNFFTSATLPAAGSPGSDALAQVYLFGISNASTQITGNAFDSLTNLSAVYLHSTWSGAAVVSANKISNVVVPVLGALEVASDGVAVMGNSLQNITGRGIAVSGNHDDVENNSLTTGNNVGIYSEGPNCTIKNNTVIDFGVSATGLCIQTLYGPGGAGITGNIIRKTVPNPAWIPIQLDPLDLPGINYRYGVSGTDGAFVPGGTSASVSPSATPAITARAADSSLASAVQTTLGTSHVRRTRDTKHQRPRT